MKYKEMGRFLSFLLPKWVAGICLAPFGIYFDNLEHVSDQTKRHEEIHWKQQVEMLIIFFYLWYVIEWFVKLFKYGKQSYVNISFEREAYDNENRNNHMIIRKPYAWIRYL